MHRDSWFKRVSDTAGQPISVETVEIDKRVALEIHGLMSRRNTYIFVKDHDIGNPFPSTYMEPISELELKFRCPDFEFLNADLGAARAAFADSFRKAAWAIAGLTAPLALNPKHTGTGLGVMHNQSVVDRVLRKSEEVNRLNTTAAEDYSALFKLMRRRLGLDLRFFPNPLM